MTAPDTVPAIWDSSPQWSPALTAGMTRPDQPTPPPRTAAPPWSPALTAGMTPDHRSGPRPDGRRAAMEPGTYGRDDPARPRRGHRWPPCRNGARHLRPG